MYVRPRIVRSSAGGARTVSPETNDRRRLDSVAAATKSTELDFATAGWGQLVPGLFHRGNP